MTTTATGADGPAAALGPPGATDPLDPVRAGLLARARADADRLLAEADEDAAATLARARSQAEAIRAAARAEGEADAAQLLFRERARVRRRARGLVLTARREAVDELRARVARELPSLRADPAYPAWRDRALAQARAWLGPTAQVGETPGGGVVGEAAGRRVEQTLAGLAEQALEALGEDVEGLWRP